jgi:hypothetical protein
MKGTFGWSLVHILELEIQSAQEPIHGPGKGSMDLLWS